MAKKRKGKKGKGKSKTQGLKPRPDVAALEADMKKLREDLKQIIKDKEDQKGKLDETQLDTAKEAKLRLNDALRVVSCVQSQAPY
jgi:hypothetical protein